MKSTVKFLVIGAIAGGLVCLAVAVFGGCATTKSVVAVAKTCAEQITSEVESAVFSAANEDTNDSFLKSIEAAVVTWGECIVGAEIDRVLETYTTQAVDAGTTVEVIKARKARLSASENTIVYQRLSAWRAAHPAKP